MDSKVNGTTKIINQISNIIYFSAGNSLDLGVSHHPETFERGATHPPSADAIKPTRHSLVPILHLELPCLAWPIEYPRLGSNLVCNATLKCSILRCLYKYFFPITIPCVALADPEDSWTPQFQLQLSFNYGHRQVCRHQYLPNFIGIYKFVHPNITNKVYVH